jgi:hypothetical protein
MQAAETPSTICETALIQKNKPAKLTADLVRRTYYAGKNIVIFPARTVRPRALTKPLVPLRAILRGPETRLFITISSSAFVFVLGFIG